MTADRTAMKIEDFPGYREALLSERDARDYAFLDLPRTICGVEVVPMTLRQLMARLALGCPFIANLPASLILQMPGPAGQITQFIWFISVSRALSRGNPLADYRARQAFCARLAVISATEAIEGIQDYLKITFLDSPPSGGKSHVPTASIAATLVDIFAAEYGWTDDKILDSPLVRLYQLLRERAQRLNPKTILFNRWSDKVRGEYMRVANADRFALVPYDPEFAAWQRRFMPAASPAADTATVSTG
jgi:hypothetical protein